MTLAPLYRKRRPRRKFKHKPRKVFLDVPEIRSWWVEPSIVGIRVGGNVTGDTAFRDGERIVTSDVVEAEQRTITTSDGRKFLLVGEPEPAYFGWLGQNGLEYDSKNPIRVRK